MAPLAQHDRWILCDSELLLAAEFATNLRAEWGGSGADAITCGYRFANLDSPQQRLDAVASLLTLWPGLAVLRRIRRVRLALGACTAVRGSGVDLAALGDELAEDFHLGARFAANGKKVALSNQIAVLDSDPLTWRDYWRHQQRVAVTYRACNPFGFAAQVAVHSMTWALLGVLTGGCAGFLVALGVWAACVAAARKSMPESGFSVPWLVVLVPAAGLVETACWILSWGTPQVWWGGKWWPVSWNGKLKR
jgi:ceramide glucosyltransferase